MKRASALTVNPKGSLLLFCNIDANAGLEFNREMVGKDGDLLNELPNVCFIKFPNVGFLPGDEVLQFFDTVHGFGTPVVIDF